MNGTRYIAMELVTGETVRELLASGPIPFRKAVAIAAQIADALAKAHDIGIVHRDLKPENLMVSGDATAKILDFGLAKLQRVQLVKDSDAVDRYHRARNRDGDRRLHVTRAGHRCRS